MIRKIVITTVTTIVFAASAMAMMPSDFAVRLERAQSLLQSKRWVDARHAYAELRNVVDRENVGAKHLVEYGLTVCAVHLKAGDAEEQMKGYLSRYAGSVHTTDVEFLLAQFYCEKGDFDAARRYFDRVPYQSLNRVDRQRYDVRMGYAEFVNGNHDKALEYFGRVPASSEYADHATYYKAYINYSRGEFAAAYDGFVKLKESDTYGELIPYYLIQLEFNRENYKYVVDNCDNLIKNTSEKERLQLLRIAAESWFRLEGFNKSLQYISAYKKSSSSMSREENYLLGYTSYRIADYEAAVEALRKVCNGKDDLAQNASYHLADCYIRLGDKRNAIHAFAMAADDQYTNEMAEDALFNYGKLLFDTGSGTFNESINVLTRYVQRHPDTKRAAEARELLIAAYYNSKNYDAAYAAIKSFPNPDATMRGALQKIAYFNGLEAYKAGNMTKAKTSLVEAESIGVSPKYNALSHFWLGEIAYGEGAYQEAVTAFNSYLKRAPRSEREYKLALYNLGYSYMALEDMPQAQRSFEGFLWLHKERDDYRGDGFNRLGDALYAQRRYDDAIKNYENAIVLNGDKQHYARYRRAIALGVLGRTAPKVEALTTIINLGEGDYVDDATYELGRAYITDGRYGDASKVLEKFVQETATSPYRTAALLDLGLVNFNLGKFERSLACYDSVITASPQSKAAKDALHSVREIYVSRGDVNGYFAYAERTGVECDLSTMTRDSLSFRAAEKLYLGGKYADAAKHFERYINDYPKGYYIDDALFQLSDSYLKNDALPMAVERMQQLGNRPKNRYTLAVLERLAEVTFEAERYAEAAEANRRLYTMAESDSQRESTAAAYIEATVASGDAAAIMAMAADVDTLACVAVRSQRRARFAKASILAENGSTATKREAYEIFADLSSDKSDAVGAQSAYEVIKASYDAGEHKRAETLVYELAESKTPHTYWLGRAFIILGDIYIAAGDAFQARATYQSIIDGYTPADDGVVDEAKERVSKLN